MSNKNIPSIKNPPPPPPKLKPGTSDIKQSINLDGLSKEGWSGKVPDDLKQVIVFPHYENDKDNIMAKVDIMLALLVIILAILIFK